jgi:lipopolysaccharide transport system permease protein
LAISAHNYFASIGARKKKECLGDNDRDDRIEVSRKTPASRQEDRLNPTALVREAIGDIVAAFWGYHVALVFGWQDVAQRYRRSKIGAFWITISLAVMIGTLSLLFGTLFQTPLQDFLPFVAVGLILWTFMVSMINEGCAAFIDASGIILQVRLPLFTHIIRLAWRNLIVLAHNLVIIPFVFLLMLLAPNEYWFLVFPGFALVLINVIWASLILAVLSARFRDIPQAVQSLMQIAFFLTPIMWMPQSIAAHASEAVLQLNPFYHLISIVREPLLGRAPELSSWLAGLGLAGFGWLGALLFYGRFRRRVPYWL